MIRQMVHFKANENTIVVSYDSKEDTAAELRDLLFAASEMNDGHGFKTIALATHGGHIWQIAKDLKIPMGPRMLPLLVDL